MSESAPTKNGTGHQSSMARGVRVLIRANKTKWRHKELLKNNKGKYNGYILVSWKKENETRKVCLTKRLGKRFKKVSGTPCNSSGLEVSVGIYLLSQPGDIWWHLWCCLWHCSGFDELLQEKSGGEDVEHQLKADKWMAGGKHKHLQNYTNNRAKILRGMENDKKVEEHKKGGNMNKIILPRLNVWIMHFSELKMQLEEKSTKTKK